MTDWPMNVFNPLNFAWDLTPIAVVVPAILVSVALLFLAGQRRRARRVFTAPYARADYEKDLRDPDVPIGDILERLGGTLPADPEEAERRRKEVEAERLRIELERENAERRQRIEAERLRIEYREAPDATPREIADLRGRFKDELPDRAAERQRWFEDLREQVPAVPIVPPPTPAPPIPTVKVMAVPCACKSGISTAGFEPPRWRDAPGRPVPGPVCKACGGRGFVYVERS